MILSLLVWAAIAGAAEPKINKANAAKDLQETARKLMLQGRRREALDKLTEAQPLYTSEKEKTALLSKKKMFAEQFLLADSFEKFQSARSAEETGNWADCIAELESVGGGDQDNVRILLEKAKCNAMSARFEASEKAYTQALALFPEDADAQLGLIEELLMQKNVTKAAPLLAALKPSSKNSERVTLAKAKILEIQGKDQDALDLLRKDYETSYGAGDRPGVLFQLGMAYYRKSEEGSIENAWQARKYLALFAKRCSASPTGDCKEAETTLAKLDKKLNQQPK